MFQLISLICPQRRWDWPLGVVFWGLAAAGFTYVIGMLRAPAAVEPFLIHYLFTTAITAPLVLIAMALIHHLNRLQTEMTVMATTDRLTGLPNRRAFFDQAMTARSGVLLMLDLDHFKKVNDTYGHSVGDAVLLQTANLLRTQVRRCDLIGRLGSEEFAVFLEGATAHEAAHIGGRLARGIRYRDGKTTFGVTASIGAVEVSGQGDVLSLLRAADRALYAAKEAGRGRFLMAKQVIDANGKTATALP
jgi:diguanylate cyclase (GGDEF)-like protein